MCKDAIKTGRYTHEKRANDIKEVKGLELRNIIPYTTLSHSHFLLTPESDKSYDDMEVGPLSNKDSSSVYEPFSSHCSPCSTAPPSLPPILDKDQMEECEDIIRRITTVHIAQAWHSEEAYDQMPEKEKEYCEQVELKTKVFGEMKPMSRDEYTFFYQTTGIDVDGRREMIETMFVPHVENCIKRFINFAKAIPGFNDLCMDDQIAIIKASRFDCWMFMCHRSFNPEKRLYLTLDSKIINMEEMLKLNDHDIIESMFSLQQRIKDLKLTLEETCIVSAFSVMFTDHCQLRNTDVVECSQEKLLNCLHFLFNKYHPEDKLRFPKLISCLMMMRSAKEDHHKAEEQFASDWASVVNFPPLLYEMWSS